MRTLYGWAITFFAIGMLTACSTTTTNLESAATGQKASAAAAPLYPTIAVWLEQNQAYVNAGLANVPEYTQAFSQGSVLALGEGFPQSEAVDPGKKRLTALRAAETAAQRNLLDFFARFAANSELKFDSYTVQLEGFLKGASIVASDYNPDRERAAVLLKLDLKGARGFIK